MRDPLRAVGNFMTEYPPAGALIIGIATPVLLVLTGSVNEKCVKLGLEMMRALPWNIAATAFFWAVTQSVVKEDEFIDLSVKAVKLVAPPILQLVAASNKT